MFDGHLTLKYSENQTSHLPANVRRAFKEQEEDELNEILGGKERYNLIEKIESQNGSVEYRGLASGGTFTPSEDEDGAFVYYNKLTLGTSRPGSTVVGPTAEIYNRAKFGLESCLRSKVPPKVYGNTPQFEKFKLARLSERAKAILNRSNFKKDKYVEYSKQQDPYYRHSRKFKHQALATNLLHVCMLKGNYDQAWRIFVILIRAPYADIRMLGRIAAELLKWKTGDDTRLLEWMVSAFPFNIPWLRSIEGKQIINPHVLRNPMLLSDLISAKCVRDGAQAALDRLQNDIDVEPVTSEPQNWAMCGILACKIADWRLAGKSFEQASKLGGYIPQKLIITVEAKLGKSLDITRRDAYEESFQLREGDDQSADEAESVDNEPAAHEGGQDDSDSVQDSDSPKSVSDVEGIQRINIRSLVPNSITTIPVDEADSDRSGGDDAPLARYQDPINGNITLLNSDTAGERSELILPSSPVRATTVAPETVVTSESSSSSEESSSEDDHNDDKSDNSTPSSSPAASDGEHVFGSPVLDTSSQPAIHPSDFEPELEPDNTIQQDSNDDHRADPNLESSQPISIEAFKKKFKVRSNSSTRESLGKRTFPLAGRRGAAPSVTDSGTVENLPKRRRTRKEDWNEGASLTTSPVLGEEFIERVENDWLSEFNTQSPEDINYYE